MEKEKKVIDKKVILTITAIAGFFTIAGFGFECGKDIYGIYDKTVCKAAKKLAIKYKRDH